MQLCCQSSAAVWVLFCRFKLEEVRSDPVTYPYLLLPTQLDWQKCTVNMHDVQMGSTQGTNCIMAIANDSSVATLAQEFVINVFISGSPTEPYCSDVDAELARYCRSVSRGYTHALGPWFSLTKAYRGSRHDWAEGVYQL